MTEVERWLWQILRSRRMSGNKLRRQVPIGRYIDDFVCPRDPVDRGNRRRPARSQGEAHRSGFLKTRAIAFCGFGTAKSWQIVMACTPSSVPRWVASPPPNPSPIKGEGSKDGLYPR